MSKFLKELKRSTIIFFIIFVMFFTAGINYVKPLIDFGNLKNAVQITDGSVQSENEDKEILASGKLKINNYPYDKDTGLTVNGYALIKTVLVYQYSIQSDGTVGKDYYSFRVNDIEGQGGEIYENPAFPSGLRNETILADVSFSDGDLVLGEDYVATLCSGYEYVDVNVANVEELPMYDNEYGLSPVTYDGVTSYYSGNPESPQVGDVKVTYQYIPESEISELTVFGVQDGNKIVTQNDPYASMSEGIFTAKELYDNVTNESSSSVLGFEMIATVFLILTIVSFLRSKGKIKFNSAKSVSMILSLALLFSISTICKADFGDYGGDNDYGGYDSYDSYDSYDYDDDYDYGDSDSDGGIFFFGETESTTSDYYSYVENSEGEAYISGITYLNYKGETLDNVITLDSADSSHNVFTNSITGFWTFCIFLIIVVFIIKKKGKSGGGSPRPAGAARTDASSLTDIDEYNSLDENFSLQDFKNKMSDNYVKLQNCWQKKNIEELRPCLTDAFYAQCERQLNNYIRNKQTNIISDITVENVDVKGFRQDGENDLIVLELTAKIKDYVIDDNTGNVIRGNKDAFRRMQYEWTVVRATGQKTAGELSENAVCPHCGAPLTLNAASRCEYCNSIITSEASDWALKEIRGLSQITLG